jgi:hypothetical protein
MPQLTIETLLEEIVEAVKSKRRWGPRFPTLFDLSRVVWNTEESRIEMDLMHNGQVRKFDLYLYEVPDHGERHDGDVHADNTE